MEGNFGKASNPISYNFYGHQKMVINITSITMANTYHELTMNVHLHYNDVSQK